MDTQDTRADAVALAGGAIVSALLEALVEKDILAPREVRAILRKAMNGLGPLAKTPVGYEATGVIATIIHDRYPQERG
jgi:hypothetical protein